MNEQLHKNTSAYEARRLLGPKSDQLTDSEVTNLIKIIVSRYEDYIISKHQTLVTN